MAKKKKKGGDDGGIPAWLITFGDMMTLLLTFFVLLVSMAKIDERRKLVVLGSIIGTFGFGKQSYDVLTKEDTRRTVETGPIQDQRDLEMLKPMLWEEVGKDLHFEQDKFVQVLSANADMLFTPNATTLSPEGERFLNRILPVLKQVSHPILLAGHTSTLRDELGESFKVTEQNATPDISWKISMARVLSVYNYLLRQGMDPKMMKVEAFGRFQPHFPTATPEGRRMNRRVDIVLDKRSVPQSETLAQIVEPPGERGEYDVDGFTFEVNETAPPWLEDRTDGR